MQAFIGTVCAFGFNFQPQGWEYCQGQTMQIANYQALYALIGTTYGGNGTTTFLLPNLSNREAIHMGQGPGTNNYALAQTGGANTVTLLPANLPAHTHTIGFQINAKNGPAGTQDPTGAYPANADNGSNYATSATPSVFMHAPTLSMSNTGNSQPISIESPCLTMNYCIAVIGIFPSRN